MFYNESKYEEDQEEHSKLIDLSGSMNCPSCYVKVAKLEINQHYLDDHPELKSACCLHCEGKLKIRVLLLLLKKNHFGTLEQVGWGFVAKATKTSNEH